MKGWWSGTAGDKSKRKLEHSTPTPKTLAVVKKILVLRHLFLDFEDYNKMGQC